MSEQLKFTPEEDRQILELRAKGLSAEKIARAIGRHHGQTIRGRILSLEALAVSGARRYSPQRERRLQAQGRL